MIVRLGKQIARRRRKCIRDGRHSTLSTTSIINNLNRFDAEDVRISNDGSTLHVEDSTFHAIWLRDHCRQSINVDTKQREVDTAAIVMSPNDNKISNIEVSECGELLEITFASGYTTTFESRWLRKHAYQNVINSEEEEGKTLWGHDFDLNSVTVSFSEFVKSDETLERSLSFLETYGVLYIRGAETNMSGTKAVADRIGRVRETLYGRMWDTAPKDVPNDTAYTNVGLPLHSDCTYMRDPPGLQMLHCESRALRGGANLFVDGFSAVHRLREIEPEAYDFFCETKLPFYCVDMPVHLKTMAPVITLSSGRVDQVRFNNADRGVLSHLTSEQVKQFYKFWPILASVIHDHISIFRHTMERGDVVIFDNHRVLHGREAFEGYRNMLGCYFDRDEWESRLRVLRDM